MARGEGGRAPDHVGEALCVGGTARRVVVLDALVVEDVAELPLHRARGRGMERACGGVKREVVVRADGAHAVHDRPEVAPRHRQRVRAAVRRPPVHSARSAVAGRRPSHHLRGGRVPTAGVRPRRHAADERPRDVCASRRAARRVLRAVDLVTCGAAEQDMDGAAVAPHGHLLPERWWQLQV